MIHCGVGGRGRWPVKLATERNDIESVGLVDVNEENLTNAREVSGLPESACFRSLEAAIDNVEADCVVIITPPMLHADQCLEAIRAGKHVLVEKPFTRSLSSAKQVVAEAASSGVKVGVCQDKRYIAGKYTMGRLIREDVYGKASFGMLAELGWRKKGVYHSGEDDHSYLWERGIHDFDTMRYVFDDLPRRMWAHSFNPPWSPYKGGAGVHAWVEFQGGMTCGYMCCFESHRPESAFRIDCEGGTLELKGGKLTLIHRERKEEEEIPIDECPDGTVAIMNGWSKYLSEDVEPGFSGRNNLVTVAMVEACEAASDEGRVIDFQHYLDEA